MHISNSAPRPYTARCGAGTGHPAVFTLSATSDAAAITEVNAIVEDGYRNEQWVSVELSDGSAYVARNVHGCAVGWRAG